MKKGVISCFVILGVVLLSLGVVSAGFSDFWGKITGSAVDYECFDPDGGKVYDVQSNVSYGPYTFMKNVWMISP